MGEQLFIWAVVDVDSREVLAVEAGWHMSAMNAEHVLNKALKACINKPQLYVDKGPWCIEALKSLGLS